MAYIAYISSHSLLVPLPCTKVVGTALRLQTGSLLLLSLAAIRVIPIAYIA